MTTPAAIRMRPNAVGNVTHFRGTRRAWRLSGAEMGVGPLERRVTGAASVLSLAVGAVVVEHVAHVFVVHLVDLGRVEQVLGGFHR